MKYYSGKLFGFTLAETLITLGVIGVVAALTLPSVINNYRNKQLQVAFKAAYSIFSQTVINMVEEDGAGLKKKYTKYDSASQSYVNANEFYDKFYKYSKLNVIGKCSYSGKIMNYNKTGEAYSSYTMVGREKIDKLLSNGMCSYLYVNSGQININDCLTVAMLFKLVGNYREAMSYCNEILEKDNLAFAGYACLSDLYDSYGRPDYALKVWDLAIDRKTSNARFYAERAKIKKKMGDIEGYNADVKIAKEYSPTIDIDESIIDQVLSPKILSLAIK